MTPRSLTPKAAVHHDCPCHACHSQSLASSELIVILTAACIYLATFTNVLILSLYMQVGIDMIGPLPLTKKGNRYIVTLVDYFSKWPEAAPLPDKTAPGVALFLYELFCRLVSNISTSS